MPATDPTLGIEWSILLAACSATPDRDKKSHLRPLLNGPVNWKHLLALADRHGVQPLLQKALADVEDAIPPQIAHEFKRIHQENVYKSLLLSRELIRILDHLSASGIESMPYKGLALAELLYGDIAMRRTGDIDVLIHAKDLPAVRKALAELGYRSHVALSEAEELAYMKSGYECVFDGAAGANLLEVQWAIQPRFYAVDFDVDSLFERAVTISIAGRPTPTPSPADLMLVLSAHAAKHVWGKLVWLCDIAQLLTRSTLDWNWIGLQARNLGIARIVAVTILLANRLLHVPIPDAARVSLRNDPAVLALADETQPHITGEEEYNVESLAYFRLMMRLRERPVDRLRFLTRLALTPGPGEWQAVRLPKPLFPLYRLVRITRLAAKAVGA